MAAFTADTLQGCEGLTVSFSDQSSASVTSWDWSFSGATPNSSTVQNPTVIYDNSGTYDVTLIVTNSVGMDTFTQTQYITIDASPAADFTSLVNGADVDFTNTSSAATSFSWDFGDGNGSTDANPMHSYTMDGNYTVQLIAMNDCGNDTITQEVLIVTPPTAGFIADVTSGCAPLTVNFTSQASSNATTWNWSFPGGTPSSSTEENPTVVYSSAGVYDVTLEVGNAAGTDEVTSTALIVVDDVPDAGFSSSVNDLDVDFTNSSSNATSYTWDFGDGNGSSDTDPMHSYTMDGTYTVQLVAINTCGNDTTIQEVTIATAPTAGFVADVTSGCAPLTVNFTSQSSANTTTWNWSFPGGTPSSSTEENPTVVYNMAGTYDVTLEVSNSSGTDEVTQYSINCSG